MRLLLLFNLFMFISTFTQAMPLDTAHLKFNLNEANQQFDKINLKLSTQNLNRIDLDSAVDTLSELDERAAFCVNEAQKKLDALMMFTIPDANGSNLTNQGVDTIFLNKQKEALSARQAECRLFLIRAKEAIYAYKKASAQFVKQEAFTKDAPLWENISQLMENAGSYQMAPIAQKIFPFSLPANWIWMSLVGFSLITACLLLFKLQQSRFANHFLKPDKLASNRKSLLCVSHVLLLSANLFTGAFFVYEFTQLATKEPAFPKLILPAILFGYLFSLNLILFFFKFRLIKKYYLSYSLDSTFFKNLTISAVTLGTIGLAGTLPSTSMGFSNEFLHLSLSLYLLATLSVTVYYIHYFCCEHCHYGFIQHHQRLIHFVTVLWAITCFAIDVQGYHRLAMHITFSSLTALAIAAITTIFTSEIHKGYLSLHQNPSRHAWILRYIGYKQNQPFTEILILKSIAQILVVALGIYLVGHGLDFATFYIESLYLQILYGIHVASIVIYPVHILSGTTVFCLLFLMFRALSTLIIRHHQFKEEKETQVALASILTYVGFTLALLAGLIIAGFNFTGLAIVAGALSVGIGLGLQSIVNNFVSGLILLIEKPIQPGDRINIDGVEGFVNKIRVRSTHIITPNQEDIIIPNSDLITHRVTNYMFSDTYCRISCEVGVVYGSDTRLVREVLLEIASLHEDVIKTFNAKPFVLFRSFAANNLVFQLWCLIKDVNKKGQVQSDINFAIEERFREHHIYMVPPKEIAPKAIA